MRWCRICAWGACAARAETRFDETTVMGFGAAILIVLSAAAISAGLIALFRPLLQRYALARPNARSSHKVPTPQGAGVAVIIATIVVMALALLELSEPASGLQPIALAAIALVAVVGAVDDIQALEIAPRLALQAIAVGLLIAVLPAEMRIVPQLPWWVERAMLFVGCLWFTNLVNFMDGMDWMTVAEVIPVTGGLAILGLSGSLPSYATTVALALCGAMLGFAPFNKPPARLFLGDVGSLPIGLLMGWLLILLAGNGYLAAALLLPLYYVCDATITLVLRIAKREPFWQAHRSHFYQRALDGGRPILEIVVWVAATNVVLVALAVATVMMPSRTSNWAAIACGLALTGWLLRLFAREKRPRRVD